MCDRRGKSERESGGPGDAAGMWPAPDEGGGCAPEGVSLNIVFIGGNVI